MPITIGPPPTVLRCSSAAGRRGSASSVRGAIPPHQPKPPPYPNPHSEDSCSKPAGDLTEQNPLRLPKLESIPQTVSPSSAMASSSDSVLTRRISSNKIDSELSIKSNTGSPNNDRGSVFPNFRILQRLATSARLRSAKKNALIHLNAKRDDKRNSPKQDNSNLPDSTEMLQSVTIQATGLQKAFDKADHDSGLSSWESPTDTKDEEADVGAFYDDNGYVESRNSAPSEGKRAKKKRPLSVKIRLKRRRSGRRTKSKSSTPITSSISEKMGSLAVPGLGPMMMVEPAKVEIYSSRYNKNKPTTEEKKANNSGVPQGSRRRAKNDESNNGVRKSLEATGVVTLRSLQQATAYGPSTSQIKEFPTGFNRRKVIENKIKKIFLSEKQSSSIRDCGVLMPCAPPATPMPETLQNTEYVPSLSDLRSQRAIKTRLTTMEKEAKEKRQRRLDEAKKQERQLQRDHVALKKHRQRQEIYALNKVMTQLEHKNFREFCEQMKNVPESENNS
ncbi:uncharacterized protein [Amphiura filiformis]|uniref:uncharacterized protein n=1 Tax=Amphiura filiformis TaxID=82378 RepID=UPI003B22434C